MSRAVVLRIGQGRFLAEADDSITAPPGPELSSRPDDFEQVVDFSGVEGDFVQVEQLIISCCKSLHDAISSIPNPEKVAVEFGVKLIGETGIPMLTKASGEANFTISVEWKPTP